MNGMVQKLKKVCVLGHFGKGQNLLNGQTVKTKIVTEELQRQFGEDEILNVDTCGGWKTIFKSPFQVFYAFKNAKNVIVFPAHNGLRVYAPLLSLQKRFFKKRKIHYVVIGGWLPDFLKNRKLLEKSLKNFDGIYVETNTMKKALGKQGFTNVVVMPNCKNLNVLSEEQLVFSKEAPYRLCTFSRVSKEKGIEDAVNVVTAVNEALGYTACTLDIYGQIDSNQTEWFENLKSSFPDFVKYGGLVEFDKSTDVLKNYFALLFPTYYEGEGFAGTLIDAFSAGVPVIASDWKYNAEIVNSNVGYAYPTKDNDKLKQLLCDVVTNTDLIIDKKKACIIEAKKYSIEEAVNKLIENLK